MFKSSPSLIVVDTVPTPPLDFPFDSEPHDYSIDHCHVDRKKRRRSDRPAETSS